MKKYVFTLFALLFAGCGEIFTGYGGVLADYQNLYLSGECESDFIDDLIKDGDDLILWNELGGSLARDCENYEKSNAYFDSAENLYKQNVDLEGAMHKSGAYAASFFTNDNARDYQGNVYEAIMLNVYKGLNYMSLGDLAAASVEFNRAIDRQRRAKELFAEEIAAQKDYLSRQSYDTQSAVLNSQTQNIIYSRYAGTVFSNFSAYANFTNPFATYMAGLFFAVSGDPKKGADLLREASAMQPESSQIAEDYELALAWSRGMGVNSNLNNGSAQNYNSNLKYIWLIYENGQGMLKDELSFSVPIFLPNRKSFSMHLALPTLRWGASSYGALTLNSRATQQVSSMDRVIVSEFKTKLPLIVTNALLRTVSRTSLQVAANEKEASLVSLVVSLVSGSLNRADVRSWTSLPRDFQAARVKNEGEITIVAGAQIIRNFNVPKDKNVIIYVKSPAPGKYSLHEILF